MEDVAEVFDISVSFAYRVVERMNADLASKNYYVILGRVPTRYVEDKIYGLEHVEQYLSEEKSCQKWMLIILICSIQHWMWNTRTYFHDRFLILDRKTAYHVGASLKDAGKKCFGINLIEDAGVIRDILQMLELETEE